MKEKKNKQHTKKFKVGYAEMDVSLLALVNTHALNRMRWRVDFIEHENRKPYKKNTIQFILNVIIRAPESV